MHISTLPEQRISLEKQLKKGIRRRIGCPGEEPSFRRSGSKECFGVHQNASPLIRYLRMRVGIFFIRLAGIQKNKRERLWRRQINQ